MLAREAEGDYRTGRTISDELIWPEPWPFVSVIESLGGEPVPASDYDFGITNVASAVRTAQVLENTGIKAHDGAIAYIERANLLTAGATIATVEARHASYLNLLNRDVPFPAPFDRAVAPRTICEVVRDAYITSSPKPYGPYKSLTALCNCLPNKPTPNVKGRSGDTWAGATAPALSLLAHPPCEEDRSSGAGYTPPGLRNGLIHAGNAWDEKVIIVEASALGFEVFLPKAEQVVKTLECKVS